MLSHITGLTRLNDKGKYTLIDNIYFNNFLDRSDSGNLLCPITDHLPNFLIIKTEKVNKNNSKATGRDFSRYNTCLYMISEMKISQVQVVLNLLFMREGSHFITIFSRNKTFDVLSFRGMYQFEKLKLSLPKARVESKSGKAPKIEILPSPHGKPFKHWQDFNNCTDILLKKQTFSGFKVLLPGERGRVTRSGSIFDCDPSSYLQLSCAL